MGLNAFTADIFSDNLQDNLELSDIGYLLALTGNTSINKKAIQNFRKEFGENGTYRIISPEEMSDPNDNPIDGLFSQTDDYIKLVNLSRRYPKIHEISIQNERHYHELIKITKEDQDVIPLFIKNPEGNLEIIPSTSDSLDVSEDFKLVYMGKKIKSNQSKMVVEEKSLKKEKQLPDSTEK
jgi:hypothetical protein